MGEKEPSALWVVDADEANVRLVERATKYFGGMIRPVGFTDSNEALLRAEVEEPKYVVIGMERCWMMQILLRLKKKANFLY